MREDRVPAQTDGFELRLVMCSSQWRYKHPFAQALGHPGVDIEGHVGEVALPTAPSWVDTLEICLSLRRRYKDNSLKSYPSQFVGPKQSKE